MFCAYMINGLLKNRATTVTLPNKLSTEICQKFIPEVANDSVAITVRVDTGRSNTTVYLFQVPVLGSHYDCLRTVPL